MQIEKRQFLAPDGNLSHDFPLQIADDILLKCYVTMKTTRLVDERMITLQRQGSISFSLSSLGEEACSVGTAAALSLEDWLYPQYREAGALFYRGFTIQDFIHQMFGNAKDLSFGRQMPNHFGSRELNVVTVSSPIGTKIPHAAGAAYAMKLQKEKSCTLCYFGEGATSEGDFHAGLNFAAVRKVPAIFFCRNNGYAISTPTFRQFASEGVAPKGIGYGIETYKIDGNDLFAVYWATLKAKKRGEEGLGPTLIEAMTYRRGAHSTSDDPTVYRKNDEVEAWALECPLLRLRLYLEKRYLWDARQEENLDKKIKEEIDQAITVAKTTPMPALSCMIKHVYAEVPYRLQEEFDQLCLS